MSRGHTLVELATALLIAALAASSLAPGLRRYRDGAAVIAARESLAGMLAEARVRAISGGGAEVRLTPGAASVAWLVASDSVTRSSALGAEYGVVVDPGGSEDTVVVAFDGLGIGRVASRTVRFTRGEAHAALIVSAHGRVRRR